MDDLAYSVRDRIVQAAQRYIGTPFHYQGRRLGIGIDCGGLILCAARDAGLPVIDRPTFRRALCSYPRGPKLMTELASQCRQVKQAQPGDIMAFWWNPINKWASHLALRSFTGIIHTSTESKQVVEQPLAEFWHDRFVAAFELPGVA